MRTRPEVIIDLLYTGRYMSNICYNLKQNEGYVLTKQDCEAMALHQFRWDELTRELLEIDNAD